MREARATAQNLLESVVARAQPSARRDVTNHKGEVGQRGNQRLSIRKVIWATPLYKSRVREPFDRPNIRLQKCIMNSSPNGERFGLIKARKSLKRDKGEIVRKGYDERAEEYNASRHLYDNRQELSDFASLLPRNARILDVGCGAGIPVAEFFVESGFEVIGIDFSEKMLRLARRNVPRATFIRQDMNRLDFPLSSFDGLTAFYSIIHVPREKHASLFESFHRILKPDGTMLVCMGPDEWEATDRYLGTKMFWSHHSPEKSLQIVKNAGFQIIFDRMLKIGGEKHYWIMARNTK